MGTPPTHRCEETWMALAYGFSGCTITGDLLDHLRGPLVAALIHWLHVMPLPNSKAHRHRGSAGRTVVIMLGSVALVNQNRGGGRGVRRPSRLPVVIPAGKLGGYPGAEGRQRASRA